MQILQLVDARDAVEKVSSKPAKKGNSRKQGKTRESGAFPYDEKRSWREKGLCLGCGGKGHFLAKCPSKNRPPLGGTVKSGSKGQAEGFRKKSGRGTKRSAKALVAVGTKIQDNSSSTESESDSTEAKEPAGNGDDLL